MTDIRKQLNDYKTKILGMTGYVADERQAEQVVKEALERWLDDYTKVQGDIVEVQKQIRKDAMTLAEEFVRKYRKGLDESV